MTPEQIFKLPHVQALRPARLPHLERPSEHSELSVWHIHVRFTEYALTAQLQRRWSDERFNTAETWRKRPLAKGEDSGCAFSCGEVELAARLRNAGFEAYWISEWSGFSYVEMWKPFCAKRSDFKERAPALWSYDHALLTASAATSALLGISGGHPDVAAITPNGPFFIEYTAQGRAVIASSCNDVKRSTRLSP
jgi:hypothetical protein